MKDTILITASKMFLNLGFKSVTMDDIAQEMGMSKKTIYTHFTTKNELVKSCADYVFDVITKAIDDVCDGTSNPIQELYDIKDVVTDLLNDETSSAQHQMQKYYPKIFKDLMARQFTTMITSVEKNLTKGVELGLYRSDINVPLIARFYFIGNNTCKNEDLFPYEQFPKREVKDKYLEYHIRGIISPKGENILNEILNK